MKKLFKILFLVLTAVVLLSLGLLQNQKEISFAQMGTGVKCENPIPTGEAIGETLDALETLYQHYKDLHDELDFLVATGEEVIGELEKHTDICDFSVCKAKTEVTLVDMSAEIVLLECIAFGYGCDEFARICFPACRALPCYGEPCPPLEKYLSIFTDRKEKIAGEFEMVNKFFKEPQVPIPEDVRKTSDPADGKLTYFELIERKLDLARKWFTPYTGCIMSDIEKEKVARGELTARFPLLCVEALRDDMYWPRPWSFYCDSQNKCQHGPDDDCIACLKTNESCSENSWFGQVNCRIFKDCEPVCKEKTFDVDCYQCLCQDFAGEEAADEKCLNWICGGSTINYVCCEELPLPSVEVIPSPPTVPTPPSVGEWRNCLSAADITNPVEQLNDASNDLIKLLNCISQKVPPKDDQGNCQWLISSISDSHGMASCKGDNWPCQCGKPGCDLQDCCYHQKYSCHYGGKDCQGKSYAFDLKWTGEYGEVEDVVDECGGDVYREANHTHISINKGPCDCGD